MRWNWTERRGIRWTIFAIWTILLCSVWEEEEKKKNKINESLNHYKYICVFGNFHLNAFFMPIQKRESIRSIEWVRLRQRIFESFNTPDGRWHKISLKMSQFSINLQNKFISISELLLGLDSVKFIELRIDGRKKKATRSVCKNSSTKKKFLSEWNEMYTYFFVVSRKPKRSYKLYSTIKSLCFFFFARSFESSIISICVCDLLYACIRNTSCSACQITMNEPNDQPKEKCLAFKNVVRLYAMKQPFRWQCILWWAKIHILYSEY